MCGICGIIKFDQSEVSKREIDQMKNLIKHRGPDDDGIFLYKNLGLGFVRLSILDLSESGHQPMISDDKRYVLIFNGEIFNYIELRESLKTHGYTFRSNSDTEVLLYAYLKWGKDVLYKLNGMWAFTIYDTVENVLFGARDRFGIKPFYYALNDRKIIFSSEIPPLLKHLNSKPNADELAIYDYLVFNRTDQTERTFFNDVKKLQHGHFIEIKINEGISGITIKRWYNLKDRVNSTNPFKSPKEYRDLFSSSVGLRLRSDVPVGVCLSGGLDSSGIVTSLLNDHKIKDLNTFSATYKTGQTGDESRFINLYKPVLDKMHFTYPTGDTLMNDLDKFITSHAEPVPTTGPYAQYKVMELAKNHVTVTLDGQGADECLGGYHYFFGFLFKDLFMKRRIGKMFSEMRHYGRIHKSTYAYQAFLYFQLPQSFRTKLIARQCPYIDKDYYRAYSRNTEIAGDLYNPETLQDSLINHFEYKLEHLLKWEDRNSMIFSIEARVPFLDYRLVEKTLASNSNWIINKGMTKYIFRQAMKNDLPSQIINRVDKIGFNTPQDEWFRSDKYKSMILDIIETASFKNRPYLNQSKVHELYKRHLERNGNYARDIWKLIHLELWYRKFID